VRMRVERVRLRMIWPRGCEGTLTLRWGNPKTTAHTEAVSSKADAARAGNELWVLSAVSAVRDEDGTTPLLGDD
jgi:hypothetical protein